MAALSSDGRYVAFRSDATNLVAGDTNNVRDVFVRDTGVGTLPAAPVLSASPAVSAVHLSWSASVDGGSAITGYQIYKGTTTGSEALLTSVGDVTSYDDTTAAHDGTSTTPSPW